MIPSSVYINEHLTSYTKALLNQAKTMVKDRQLAFAKEGQVIVKNTVQCIVDRGRRGGGDSESSHDATGNETWLDGNGVGIELEGYKWYKTSRGANRNDGVLVYVRECVCGVSVQETELGGVHGLLCDFTHSNKQLFNLLSVYRTHDNDLDDFTAALSEHYSHLTKTKTYIRGDKIMNSDSDVKLQCRQVAEEFNNYFTQLGLLTRAAHLSLMTMTIWLTGIHIHTITETELHRYVTSIRGGSPPGLGEPLIKKPAQKQIFEQHSAGGAPLRRGGVNLFLIRLDGNENSDHAGN
ncbi:hypothetical protein J6590_048293 [Homalodisca vitripennis]|nr:hypothetical protein J6590_048293 [Homalodisca vitripennis]